MHTVVALLPGPTRGSTNSRRGRAHDLRGLHDRVRGTVARELLWSRGMRNSIAICFTTIVPILGGCFYNDDTLLLDEQVGELEVSDCAALPSPFSQAGCPKPSSLTDAQRKQKCAQVKSVALNDYKKQLGKDPDCSDGWVFGPDNLLKDCIEDSGKKLCKLAATNPPSGKQGWPATNHYSQCLNDWVVYCTDTYPDTMGIRGDVCFVDELDYDRLPPDSATAREVCQRLEGNPKRFPDKCSPDLCDPPPSPTPTASPSPTPSPTTSPSPTP